jgi:hypothetical protein
MYSPVGWESMAQEPNPFDPVKYPQGYKFYSTLNNYDKAAVYSYINRNKGGKSPDGIGGMGGILHSLSNLPEYASLSPS